MEEQQFDGLLDALHSSAAVFAQKSTRLSDLLRRTEQYLAGLPGKLEYTYVGENCALTLKRQKGEWQLLYTGPGWSGTRVVSAPLDVKVASAGMLKGLIAGIIEKQKEQIELVDVGLAILSEVPFLADDAAPADKEDDHEIF